MAGEKDDSEVAREALWEQLAAPQPRDVLPDSLWSFPRRAAALVTSKLSPTTVKRYTIDAVFQLLELDPVELTWADQSQPLQPFTDEAIADSCVAGAFYLYHIGRLVDGDTSLLEIASEISFRVNELRREDFRALFYQFICIVVSACNHPSAQRGPILIVVLELVNKGKKLRLVGQRGLKCYGTVAVLAHV